MASSSKRRKHDNKYKSLLHIAVVCSSNMNRSMEAHAFLSKKGYNVDSYGTGDKVKLPGPTADKPNVYEFGTTYEDIYTDLKKRDRDLYTQNGILNMLDRNRRIKKGPQRLQDTRKKYDIIFTAEERVYDQVLEHFSSDTCSIYNQPVHVINLDIQDNHEEATIGAFMMFELMSILAKSSDIDDDIDDLLQDFEAKCNRPILHTVVFY